MKKIYITPEQIEEAKDLYNFKCLKNSITNGESQVHGALGELISMQVLDLRDNPGGYVFTAKKMIDEFLKEDQLILITKNYS